MAAEEATAGRVAWLVPGCCWCWPWFSRGGAASCSSSWRCCGCSSSWCGCGMKEMMSWQWRCGCSSSPLPFQRLLGLFVSFVSFLFPSLSFKKKKKLSPSFSFPALSLVPKTLSLVLLLGLSLFIGKNGAGAPSITQRLVGQWPVRWSKGVGTRRERRDGFFENGFCLLLLFNGGRRKMNSVVQNDTVLAFLFFFFFFMKRRRFG